MKLFCMKKALTGIVCLLFAASALTACGTDADNAAQTTAASTAASAISGTSTASVSETTTDSSVAAETTTAASSVSAAGSVESSAAVGSSAASTAEAVSTAAAATSAKNGAAISGDITDAKKVLEQFMQAVEKQDEETALRLSNLGIMKNAMLELAKQQQGEQAEQLKEQAEKLFLNSYYPQFGKFNGDYTIDDGMDAQAYADAINKALQDESGQLAETIAQAQEKQPELAVIYQQLMQPIKRLCVFTVNSKQNGASQEMYLRLTDNGWQIDVLSFDMFRYVAKSKLASANAMAKKLYLAANTGLTEMDVDGCNVKKLAGTYTYRGDALDKLDKNAKDGIDALMQKVLVYNKDIEKAEEFSFIVDKTGVCTAAAVKMKGTVTDIRTGEREIFGAYPKQIMIGEAGKYLSLKDALAYAQSNNPTSSNSSK